MTAAHVSILLADTPTADEVKPGWIALLIVFLMGVALFFLMWSMIKQFRKIDFEDDEPGDSGGEASGNTDVAGGARGHDDEHETNGSSR